MEPDSDENPVAVPVDTNPVVYIKTVATISPVEGKFTGKFTTTTVRNLTYLDGTGEEMSKVVEGKVHAKQVYLIGAATWQEWNRQTTTKKGIKTTTAYAKHVYGFQEPVVTEEVINMESGPAEPTGCACNLM